MTFYATQSLHCHPAQVKLCTFQLTNNLIWVRRQTTKVKSIHMFFIRNFTKCFSQTYMIVSSNLHSEKLNILACFSFIIHDIFFSKVLNHPAQGKIEYFSLLQIHTFDEVLFSKLLNHPTQGIIWVFYLVI